MKTLTVNLAVTGIMMLTALTFASAQNLETFKQFETFNAGDTKFLAEIKTGNLKGFKTKEFLMTYDSEPYNDTTIQYSDLKYTNSLTDTDIYLLFCDGLMYWKSIEFNYNKNKSETAVEFFNDLKNYVINNYAVLDSKKYTIHNESYGSQIGESTLYYLNKDEDNHQTIEIGLKGDMSYSSINSTIRMTGFIVFCKVVDLSSVPLNIVDGYFGYQ